MRLVEREREVAALTDLLRQTEQGHGGIAVVSGGTGSGKTELLNIVRGLATDSGFVALQATASWAERLSPGSVLEQLPRYADTAPDHSGAVSKVLARLGAIRADADGRTLERWPLDAATAAALHQLSTEIVRISAQAPVLLCVDDIQFTDSLSLHWILQLVHALRSSRIALVVAECTLSKSAHPHLHTELLRQPNYRRLDLRALSPAGVGAVLAGHMDAHRAAALTADCHRISGGNPLLVRALVEDQRHTAALTDARQELVVGDAYADTVLSCLHRGRTPALRLAQALAILDEPDTGTGRPVRLLDEEATAVEQCRIALEAGGRPPARREPQTPPPGPRRRQQTTHPPPPNNPP
ncbi:ATP-binding protein, partial [Streptomyces sp. NPDC056486]|uniref:ATP-binding protein n=1 Tax=Streptomyces sp. NPDC056486 TaxID=3345835 RepID=UPI0036A5F02B